MKRNIFRRMAALLLCALLYIGMMGAAYAADETAPVSDISIQISLPSDWAADSAAVKFTITDKNGAGFASAQAKTDLDGDWKDVTNQLEQWDSRHIGQVSISDNCTVYVSVTGHDGKVYEESRYIECFDHTAPTVRVSISGQLLRIEATDSQSGVTEISAGGKKYTNLSSGKLDLPLKDFTSEQISVQAMDKAGNKSRPVQIENPVNQEQPAQVQNPVVTTPAPTTPVKNPTTPVTTPTTPSTTATTPTQSTTTPNTNVNKGGDADTGTKPLTPDGQGGVVDNATNEDGKEFFTIATKDENTFYLVIDKQRGEDNVYFLDTVKESDLLSLAEKDKEDTSQSAIPDPEPECLCINKCVPGEVKTDCPVCVLSLKDCTGKAPAADPDDDTDTEPEKPEKSSDSTLILVVIAALAVGGVGYYLKIYKPKHDLDDADDFDDLTGGDEEETINEDEEEPAPKRDPFGEPEEPDYPGGYYDEPGEDE